MSKETILSSQSIKTDVEFGEEETWAGRNRRDGIEKRFQKVES